jgi:thymidylate synthase (FAD)
MTEINNITNITNITNICDGSVKDTINSLQINRVDLYNKLGFVELIDMMPRIIPVDRTADVAISRNARVSYAMGDKTVEEDAKLVRYLMHNYHTSPSESVVFQFRIRLPIFVERQLIRHRTARVNEQSYRYIAPKDEFYYPELRMQSRDNKQGSSGDEVPNELDAEWDRVKSLGAEMYQIYSNLCARGVAREVARVCLPVSLMTEIMWQMDLHNLLHFLRLRLDPHAQQEIRELAEAILVLIRPAVPVSVAAFEDFRLNAVTFTAADRACLNSSEQNISKALKEKLTKIGFSPAK